jgi:hypothetical protein
MQRLVEITARLPEASTSVRWLASEHLDDDKLAELCMDAGRVTANSLADARSVCDHGATLLHTLVREEHRRPAPGLAESLL